MHWPLSFPRARRLPRPRGFTLLETLVAGATISLFALAALAGIAQMNRFATASRLQTLALALAQERIDEVLTTPWQVNAPRPALLRPGGHQEANLVINSDAFNNHAELKSAFTYLGAGISVARSTQITNLDSRRLRADVTVTYQYRDRAYRLQLTTLRVTDTI